MNTRKPRPEWQRLVDTLAAIRARAGYPWPDDPPSPVTAPAGPGAFHGEPGEDRPLGQGFTLWPDRSRGPWQLVFHFWLIGGRVECAGLDVRSFVTQGDGANLQVSATPAGPKRIGRGLLARLPLGQLSEAALENQHHWVQAAAAGAFGAPEEVRELAAQQEPAYRRTIHGARVGRRPKYGHRHYAEVARVYLRAWHEDPRAPTKAVAEHFGVSRSRAANWVAQARRPPFELLASTTRGVIEPPVPRRKGKE